MYLRDVFSYLFDISYGMLDKIDREQKDFSEYWTQEYLHRMYNILCVYFETLNINNYLLEFKQTFFPIISDEKRSTQISSTLLKYGDTDEELYLLIEWKKYLAPFDFFWDREKNKSSKKIIEFLEFTNEILKITNTPVNNEDNINRIVREVANFYYNGVIPFSEGYFVHQFKHYKPDVIIRELKTAIEYKLIRKNDEIGIKLDELIIDAKRYSGNSNNKHCIAVLCLSKDVSKTKKEIKEEWNNLHFPANWEIVIINDVNIESKNKGQYLVVLLPKAGLK